MTGPISKWKSRLRRGKDQPKVSQLGQAAREPPAQPVTSYFQAITCPQPLPPPAQTPSQHALFPGIVAVTHVLAYLETVTGRGSQDARLQTLACSLDPNGEGPQATVDLDTFLVVMRDWIATCQLDGWVPVPGPHPRKSFLRSNLIPAHCNWRPLGAGTECGWKEAEEERKVKGCNWKGRRSEDKVPGMGRQRESREQNIKAGKEKGEVGGLREAPPHLFPNPALAPPAFPSGRVHLPSGLAFLSRVPPLT